jgi:hypothetical protein
MDIVYICRRGQNEELRYSLRSVVKNLPESRVWVVGYKPDWYVGDFIPVPDTSNKFDNIRKALKVVCSTNRISEDFVFMHDDIYIVSHMPELKPYYSGTLANKISTGKKVGTYHRKIVDVNRYLISLGYNNPLNYEVHVPMPMNRNKLNTIIDNKILERSLYGNKFVTDAIELPRDVKNYDGLERTFVSSYDYINGDLPFLSSHDVSFIKMKDFLATEFPEPSRYER